MIRMMGLCRTVRPVLEQLEARIAPSRGLPTGNDTASVRGSVYSDRNNNGQRDLNESGLNGITVYLDANGNGRLDSGEKSTRTTSTGEYSFTGLAPGSYQISQVVPAGWLPAVTANPTPGKKYTSSTADRLIGLDRLRADPRFSWLDGTGYSVVVLDTGIDPLQPAFGPDLDRNGAGDSILVLKDFTGSDGPTDDSGHGTEMASLIASRDLNFPGVAPGANLIVLKVLGGKGGSFTDIQRALHWVVENADRYRICCVNLSLGDDGNHDQLLHLNGLEDDLAALVTRNITVVAAAGNQYKKGAQVGLSYPAADPYVIPVGAVWDRDHSGPWNWSDGVSDITTGADRIVSFSQRLPGISQIFAPGTDLVAASAGGGTTRVYGTSAAAAVVSGVIALAQQLAVNSLGRMLSPTEMRELLTSTAKTIRDGDDENDSVSNTGSAFARVDAFALVERILTSSGAVTPGARPESLTATLVTGRTLSGANLGLACPVKVSGITFVDVNGDGRRNAGESVLPGVTVYADRNGNGNADAAEPLVQSDTTGRFTFTSLDPGTYEIRYIAPRGQTATLGGMRLVVKAGLVRTDLEFGSRISVGNHAPLLLAPARLTPVPVKGPVMGDRVDVILSGVAFDADANSKLGVAIIGTGGAPGKWQYSRDGGVTWLDLGAVSPTSARLLAGQDRLRFVPASSFGRAWMRYRVWDGTAGRPGELYSVGFGEDANPGPTSSFSARSEKAIITIQ